MTDDFIDENGENEEESFADLFESYNSGMNDDLQVGDKIRGRVISIGRDSLFVETGTKVDGIVDRTEMMDKKGEIPLAGGDEIELYVVAVSEHEIRLSRAISGAGGFELLNDAFHKGIPVEGAVSGTCKGGLNVEIMKRRAFCPVSQIDVNYVENPEDYVGNTYEFLITRLEEKGKNIVVSRRKILARAMEKAKAEFLETLKEGDFLEGTVTRLMPYGAFVELIPGVEGMVHISEMTWSRAEKVEGIVQTGDKVSVTVIQIGDDGKKNQKKISLSMKRVGEDPWETVAEKFQPGEKVSGKVTRCMNFGAFVEIAPGIEGLVHISEMSYVKRVVHPEDVVTPGEIVSVLIREIDLTGRRISLSMRAAEGDPWLEVSEKFSVGQVVTGTLEKKEKFGYFVSLSPGITGLLPKSKMGGGRTSGGFEGLREGGSITVAVEEIHPLERKITLGPGDSKDEGAWKDFAKAEAPAPMSDLAEKLRAAMAAKKAG